MPHIKDPNPSGLPDDKPLIHEHEGKTHELHKVPQPIELEHHEEGHEDPAE